MKIGKLLFLYRVTNEISVRDMGKILNISASTISRIENNKVIDAKTTLRLINWLFEDKDKQ